jgi:hypothetical protein
MILILPYLPIMIGVVMLIFAKQVGLAFTKIGKAIWKTLTFGANDMGFLYSEKRAPIVMRIVGGGLIILGLPIVLSTGWTFKGPNQYKAMYEAEKYLASKYGSSNELELSTMNRTTDNEKLDLNYKIDEHTGVLHAVWLGEKYQFEEKK